MTIKIVIIGAGPAGLSCAWELAKKNHEVHVYEAQDAVGGMSKSIALWGQIVDLGPHRFFSNNVRINNFFKEAVEDDYTLVNRQTRIFYNKSFFNYPLKLFNVLQNLNLITIIQILYFYGKQRIFPIKNPKTFEEWVTNRFGHKLYEIFFKNYSEKLWGIDCSRIDADWAAQRIKTLSLVGAVWSALTANRGNKHKTLVDQFAYPNEGTGAIYTSIADKIEALGGKVHLNTPIKKIILEDNIAKGVELVSGEKVYCDTVVSTMPLTLLVKGLSNIPFEVSEACSRLRFRNTTLVYLEVNALNLFPDNWIYVHSNEVKHGRITNFSNWSPSINKNSPNSILCLEFWSFDEDSMWTASDEELGVLAKKELKLLSLIPENVKILSEKVVKVKRCYPVYEIGYNEHLKIIQDHLDQIDNLNIIGRYGAFKYNNQDHSILMGLLCAENINSGKLVTDLWSINTDTEYQEEAVIKDVLRG